MSSRRLPVRPDLDQLKHQAKDLLRAMHAGDAAAVREFQTYHPNPPEPTRAKLADAQFALARSYEAGSWPRLVLACNLVDAIWRDDVDAVRELVLKHPQLLHENAVIRSSNWGPPLTYAANLGRDRIITMLHELGATRPRARPRPRGAAGPDRHSAHAAQAAGCAASTLRIAGGPAYTLSTSGTALMFELGAQVRDENGEPYAPVDVVLQTDSRKPEAKHAILEMYVRHGLSCRTRRRWRCTAGGSICWRCTCAAIPRSCAGPFATRRSFLRSWAVTTNSFRARTRWQARPCSTCAWNSTSWRSLAGCSSMAWTSDAPAAVDPDGFGGHTALFGAVVSYPNFWMNYTGGWAHSRKPMDAAFARLLLDHGADPNARASLREQVMSDNGRSIREHRDLTPLAWGERFHDKMVVSEPAMRLIAERGGKG